MGLLLAFLKMLGTAATKGAVGLGKAALTGAEVGAKALGKGATEVGKWSWNRMQQGAKAGQPLSTDELVKAFGSLLTQPAQAAEPFTNEQQYSQTPNVDLGRVEVQRPQLNIPSQYLNMMPQQNQPIQPTNTYPGFFTGMKEEILGMPSSYGEIPKERTGRQTAYAAGGLIPKIIMSRLGQPSSAEAAGQQALLAQRQNLAGQPVIDPETGQILFTRPKGSVFQPELPEEKQARALETEEKKGEIKQQQKYTDMLKQYRPIQKDLTSLVESLNKIPAGRLAGPQAYLEALAGGEGSEYVFNYTRDRDLILSKVAKTFGGEVGVLTEGDIKRIRDAFPPLWMNQRERDFQVKWINDYIQRRIDEYSGGQQSQQDFSQMSDEELRRIAGGE